MIITCPNCSTRFTINPAALGEHGRNVRCAKCGHRWLATPPPPVPPPEALTTLAPVPATAGSVAESAEVPPGDEAPLEQAPETARQPAPKRTASVLGWLAVVLVLLILAGLVVGRNELVARFPGLTPVYRSVGLPITLASGLEFRNLTTRRLDENGLAALVVEGEIHNVSGAERKLPPVRVVLIDDGRKEVESGLFDPQRADLPAGGMTRFEAKLVDPPSEAKSFRVTFDATP